jgi:hypothetical protein
VCRQFTYLFVLGNDLHTQTHTPSYGIIFFKRKSIYLYFSHLANLFHFPFNTDYLIYGLQLSVFFFLLKKRNEFELE